jgi:hypothetical protein
MLFFIGLFFGVGVVIGSQIGPDDPPLRATWPGWSTFQKASFAFLVVVAWPLVAGVASGVLIAKGEM